MATIRAYREQNRFLKHNEDMIDIENRAYLLTIYNQRWLGLRLDILGSLLSFIVAIIAVTERYSISPSEIGLILSYILSVQSESLINLPINRADLFHRVLLMEYALFD